MENTSVRGTVIECLAGGLYKIILEDGREKLAYLAGKMKLNHIRVLVGDSVDVVLDPYKGKATNRIVKRVDK